MADATKAQKLASARKKFKELKKEKKKNATQTQSPNNNEIVESEPISREQTPTEYITQSLTPINVEQQSEYDNHPLPNYFSNAIYGQDQQPPATFFDNLSQNIPISNEQNFFNNYTSPNVISSSNYFNNDAYSQNDDKIGQEIVSTVKETLQIENVEETKQEELQSQPIVESLQDFLNETSVAKISTPEDSKWELQTQQLQSQLTQERIRNEQLNTALQEYQTKIVHLESELGNKEQVYLQTGTSTELEMSKLREDLANHMKTVDILVAQKSELVANLAQVQSTSKLKIEECEELQGRLKASRSRVADLEREVNTLKNDKLQNDSLGKENSSELIKLREDFSKLKEEKEELLQDLLESREKVKTATESNDLLQKQVEEISNQLSLANIKIQQLANGHKSDEINSGLKIEYEKRIFDLSEEVKTLIKERDESSLQYQQYVQQLNTQMGNLARRLEDLQKENESLLIQEQNRVKHIGELEMQLQNVKTDVVFKQQPIIDTNKDLIEKLREENNELKAEITKVRLENDDLSKEIDLKSETILEMQNSIKELQADRPDNAKLLAIMESDKVAAARAVQQNSELKQQMESMQEVFVKLNTDKVELTEMLTQEQKNSKELLEKLQKTEIHLQTLATAIEVKDKELSHLRENAVELNKHYLETEQLTDRLRHYEANDNSLQSLQIELQEANLEIKRLNNELTLLKEKEMVKEVIGERTIDVPELENKLKQLEIENAELKKNDTNHNNQLDRETAMQQLEQKFLKTMKEVADLTEEKQRLEHLVLQLQGETETIGEYVALYQQQRSLLKQKALEKDQQLTQLADDREKIKEKLDKLNELIQKLVVENGSVPSELLAQHEQIQAENAQELCEQHARMHNEINKIQNGGGGGGGESIESDGKNTETAEKIIALLSEIKSSNLVQPSGNIHHCAWCSGQLITV